jgi:hypothetical protein
MNCPYEIARALKLEMTRKEINRICSSSCSEGKRRCRPKRIERVPCRQVSNL